MILRSAVLHEILHRRLLSCGDQRMGRHGHPAVHRDHEEVERQPGQDQGEPREADVRCRRQTQQHERRDEQGDPEHPRGRDELKDHSPDPRKRPSEADLADAARATARQERDEDGAPQREQRESHPGAAFPGPPGTSGPTPPALSPSQSRSLLVHVRAGTPASLATLAQSSYSGDTVTARPSNSPTFTATVPCAVSTFSTSRSRARLATSVDRTPSVPVSRNRMARIASTLSGEHSTETVTAGRPFFMTTGASQASWAPAANSSSITYSTTSGLRSSTFVSSRTSVESRGAGGAVARDSASSPTRIRRTLGKSRRWLPAPYPTDCTDIRGSSP